MKYFIYVLAILAILWSSYYGVILLKNYKALQDKKQDLAEIQKVNYGIFNMKIWKEKAFQAFENKINGFEISGDTYKEVEKELKKYLYKVNKEYIESGKIFDQVFEDANNNPKTNKAFLKLLKDNASSQIKNLNIPQYIPGMAKKMALELRSQEPRLKEIMHNELNKLLQDEDLTNPEDPRSIIYTKYGKTDYLNTVSFLSQEVPAAENEIKKVIPFVFIPLVLTFMLLWFKFDHNNIVPNTLALTAISILTLIIGIKLPMIHIEMLLNGFALNVLGTDIGFERQTIFYQSKSIMDVTQTLLESEGWDLKLVGVLVVTFSVIFPAIKLILTALFMLNHKLRTSKVVKNFIFHLGKWSMADVFVVALFMSYIGFYGIVSSQLSSIENNQSGFAVETLNNTKLLPGVLFFTTYCIMSIILGILVNRYESKLDAEKIQ